VKRLRLEVGPRDGGRTLQALLHDRAGISHEQARGLIDAGVVRAATAAPGAPLHPIAPGDYARRLTPGEVFEAVWDEGQRYRPRARERPGRGYRVVYRDDHVVVVDKGPEVLSVPSALREEDSLLERLLETERARGVRRPTLVAVHRLDRDTSGLLLFARSAAAAAGLKEQFAARAVERRYLAVVDGRIEADQGRFESRLVEDPRTLKVRTSRRAGEGREAVTEYRVTERLPQATVVTVRLGTGRKNQIRVHFAEARHPLVGDRRYGRPSPLIGRTALHAMSLAFTHPASGLRVSYQSPLPADLRRLLRRLRSRPG
jgi:23S rRNA pseudouridine1911/1915/1917 synthase